MDIHNSKKAWHKKWWVWTVIAAGLLVMAVAAMVGILMFQNTQQHNTKKSNGMEQQKAIKDNRRKGAIPNLVGRNANQVGYWSYGGDDMRITIKGAVNLPIVFVAPNGESITQDNAKMYKVVSQEPKAGTTFEIQYEKDEQGREYDGLVKSTGVQEILLNVEKIKSD